MTRKQKAPKAPTAPQLSERKLIEACCAIAGNLAAFSAAFKVDPDGSNSHAVSVGDKFTDAKERALAAVTATPAKTIGALYAKAKLVGPILDDDEGGLEASTEEFIRGFASEVAAFLKEPLHEQWLAENKARVEQAKAAA